MLLTEYNEEKILANSRKEGEEEKAVEVAIRMIRRGCDFHFIVDITQLPEKRVQQLINEVKSEE